jgi:hypothetical protein
LRRCTQGDAAAADKDGGAKKDGATEGGEIDGEKSEVGACTSRIQLYDP